jgi:hypothetical protein
MVTENEPAREESFWILDEMVGVKAGKGTELYREHLPSVFYEIYEGGTQRAHTTCNSEVIILTLSRPRMRRHSSHSNFRIVTTGLTGSDWIPRYPKFRMGRQRHDPILRRKTEEDTFCLSESA